MLEPQVLYLALHGPPAPLGASPDQQAPLVDRQVRERYMKAAAVMLLSIYCFRPDNS